MDERRNDIQTGIEIAQKDRLKQSAVDALEGRQERSHSRDDALSPRQFEELAQASHAVSDDTTALECRAALYLTGRVGLRKGELAHLKEGWIDWSAGTITIPEHQPCRKGQHGEEVCGYCRRRAEDRHDTNNIDRQDAIEAIQHVSEGSVEQDVLEAKAAQLIEEVNITMDEAVSMQWKPKTDHAARTIPFDFDVRVELALEQFFETFDSWEKSASTANRRINRLQDKSNVECNVYPHSLRATAASYHASRDISVHSLMSIMGWADPSTARNYVAADPSQAAKEIRSKHR